MNRRLIDLIDLRKQIKDGDFRLWRHGDDIYISHVIWQEGMEPVRGDTVQIGKVSELTEWVNEEWLA